ncbi:unnamed protein product [Calypogeia fissa]
MADSVMRELGVNNGGRIVFDRSRVRILVCDPSTSPDVVDLLRGCSYQVIAVQNARQVMEVCRTGMAQVDLILAEVDLPKKRGFKMLKCFMKEEQLKQIPIVMMSSRDEMAVVGKCLRLGAADYLVKPLRTNELLNLWTHMWRRRRMLGLTEKHLISGSLNANDSPLDLLFPDTSNSNTTSTDFFSEDSNDQARRNVMDGANSRLVSSNDEVRRSVMDGANSRLASSNEEARRNAMDTANIKLASANEEACPSAKDGANIKRASADSQRESEPGLELTLKRSSDLAAVEGNLRSGQISSPPKKTEFKIGESSAFLAYTKFCDRQGEQQVEKQSKVSQSNDGHDQKALVPPHGRSEKSERSADRQPRLLRQGSDARDQSPMVQHSHAAAAVSVQAGELSREHSTISWEAGNCTVARGSNLNVYMGPKSLGAPNNGPGWNEQLRPRGFPQPPVEQMPMFQMHIQNESLMGVPTIPPFAPSHHLPPNMLAANMHPSAMMAPPMHLYCGLEGAMGLNARIPPLHSLPPGHPGHALAHPSGFSYYPISLPPQMGQPAQMWSPMPSMPISEHKLEKAERREAALSKFRQKRKDRCFEKKIRYVSRKRLAEQRPRNRGQFVRRNNGSEAGGGVDESEDEDEEDDTENMSVGEASDSYPVDRVALFVRL